jgi:succinate-semialdehyde dehydrogenase/glutarate-semialdehyde dehydrogenase
MYEKLELLINGQFRQGSEGKSEPVYNPATGEVLGALPHASKADLDEALAASEKAYKIWRGQTALSRQKVLEKACRILEDRFDEVAENLTKEMGKPLVESKLELGVAIDVIRWYGEEGKRIYGRTVLPRMAGIAQTVRKDPVGPVIAFVAWNFPALNVVRKVAGALAAGCSVIIKPSEETPGTAIAIARALVEAGVPDGAVNMVFGVPAEVSEHLCSSPIPRKLSFTGSVPVGIHLQKLAAENMIKCTMELGGHSPVMVFEDGDIEKAAKIAAAGKYRNAGQVCVSPTRFFVQKSVHGKFVDAFVSEVDNLNIGDGMDDGVTMGPLIADRRIDVMDGLVQDAVAQGANLLRGGSRLNRPGSFYAPTVLDNVSDDARIMNDEPFGPVAPIDSFVSVDEVVARANRLPFGLAAYAFTEDPALIARLKEDVETGLLAVNSTVVSVPETPFGGVKHSGYGSEGGIEGLEAFLTTRFVSETY